MDPIAIFSVSEYWYFHLAWSKLRCTGLPYFMLSHFSLLNNFPNDTNGLSIEIGEDAEFFL